MLSENIYTHPNFVDNKYQRLYFKIVNNAKNRFEPPSEYTEKHHIIPHSMGGSNSQENLVVLTLREHFICHYLLVKFTKDSSKKSMTYAFAMMKPSNKHKNRYFNSTLYESLRSLISKIISETHKGRKKSCEQIRKQSESLKNSGKVAGKNNGMSKKWKITSPEGVITYLDGNFHQFCRENKLSPISLRNNIGKVIPTISVKFRDQTENCRELRINTTGWRLDLL